jgi:cysteine desulfurase
MRDQIYLDYAATTPCDEGVLAAMQPYFTTMYGNPNSLHGFGQEAMDGLSYARDYVRHCINAEFEEIVFTSGATESNNIAIRRTAEAMSKGKKHKFATLKTEHKSVIDCADYLKMNGHDVTYINVHSDGLLDFDHLNDKASDGIGMLSVCLVNNETGVIQDIERISKICRMNEILLHVDATQAFGKIPINVKELDLDFMSASGHKIYGPNGIGILYCRKQNMRYIKVPRANHEVEFGVRSGTVPVPLCVGMGHASKLAADRMQEDYAHIKGLRDRLVSGITSQLNEVRINGAAVDSNYPGITNMSFRGCEGEALMMEANRIAVSSGSACTSNKLSISHVLSAMGISADVAQSSLRISIGRNTTESDIDVAIESLINATNKLRKMSPVWDMIEAGANLDAIFKGKH